MSSTGIVERYIGVYYLPGIGLDSPRDPRGPTGNRFLESRWTVIDVTGVLPKVLDYCRYCRAIPGINHCSQVAKGRCTDVRRANVLLIRFATRSCYALG